jgi:hypothetical protein
MNESQNPATSPGERLTTEQLATAGAAKSAAEPRAFDERENGEDDEAARLLPAGEASELHRAWESIQGGFVDEPRKAVEDADHLVAQTMTRLAEVFAEERDRLEQQWDRGSDVSTEDLRLALQRYRTFFGRLLKI